MNGKYSVADYVTISREMEADPSKREGLRELRVAVLSTCTMSFMEPFLRVEAAARGLHVRTFFGPFGQVEQVIANEESGLYSFAPEVVVLLVRPDDINPDAFARYHASSSSKGAIDAAVDRALQCATELRKRSTASILVANFAAPAHMPLGPFDANAADSLGHKLTQANARLREGVAQIPGSAVWDYAGLVHAQGAAGWGDPRLWALARVPVAARNQPALAAHLARSLNALTRPAAKCLVLDLDNTLWGGVIGDDGLEGIQVGDDYPGNVYKNFQRAVLGLADRGILLAVVSKNDPEVAEHAIRSHPEMLIRMEHLSALRINWRPKSANLQEIAKELNIGIDALVHFDDNPAERAEISTNAPGVLLVDVPTDPIGYEAALHDCGFFDSSIVSNEDRARVAMYKQERAREESRRTAESLDSYLDGLGMSAEIGRVDNRNLARVAQLIAKTNQFNLTTRRHSSADVARMVGSPDHVVVYLRLQDRFGDLGLIAVGILEMKSGEAVIDSFVMSCRAMGREAEKALASELVAEARRSGCPRIVGEYIPSPRNSIVADLYPKLGFQSEQKTIDSITRFSFLLDRQDIEWPSAIRREVPGENGDA